MPKQLKTRKRVGKDLDEIANDLRPEKYAKLTNQPIDPDLPGDGQFYCVQCSRHFINDDYLEKHRKSKGHKKRIKELNDQPYSQKEAEAAGGVGSYSEFKKPQSSGLRKKKQFDSGIVC